MEERIGELDIFMKRHISFTEMAAKEHPDLRARVERSMCEEEETGKFSFIKRGPLPSVEELLHNGSHRAVNYGFNPDELEERIVRLKKLNAQGDCL